MAYTTINKSTAHFNTKLYSGNGYNGNAQNGIGFRPDWTWIKHRNGTAAHVLTDAVRGTNKHITADTNAAQVTSTAYIASFDSDGFTLNNDGDVNGSGRTYASWNWKAGGGQGSSNTDGSINTTYTSVNTTAGFSISQYDGTGSGATVGHGLGATPKIILWKRLDSNDGAVNWIVQSPLLDNRNKLVLNTTEAKSYNSSFANVDNWSNSVFTLGTYEGQNDSNGTYVAYAFAEKTGYSKFGTYTGNGSSSNGTFVYTGFKPKLVIVKEYGSTGNWIMKNDYYDNQNDYYILANDNAAETSGSVVAFDLLSNGFKLRGTAGDSNGSGNSILYMAFGQSLVGTNNVPCTAR